ncbi:FKBP-type peptidyl-prolyl cis-trans isomerase [Tenacibaculum sp. SDUM215027]|uniref:FKBP-type peptidyl-prolyl cis-trans isomerase n=1 Tax=Tenacibaculum sp. SDUM215027 TaxID=3422596 RepID=UPI003D318E55
MRKILYLFIAILSFSCSSNSSDPEEDIDYDAMNEVNIQKYLTENNLTAEKSETGLYYIIENEGRGSSPTYDSNVTVNYKGYFLSGEVFGEDDEVDFNLTKVIPGFSEGIQYLKEGGNVSLIIPSKLAYGDTGSLTVPPGAVLIFEVTLLSIN